jgi:hypothetical protein
MRIAVCRAERLALLALLAAALSGLGCAGASAARGALARTPAGGPAGMGDFGIRILPPRLAAAGYVVDLRCEVVDPERAAPLFERQAEARLALPATGQALAVAPGSRLPEKPAAGRTYSLLFDNTQRRIEAGARVTLTIGDLEVKDLTVGE